MNQRARANPLFGRSTDRSVRRATGAGARLRIGTVLLLLAACGGNPGPDLDPRMTDPNVAGVLVIEQFLRAANESQLERMAQLHGSTDGPISSLYPRAEVQARMQLMASILRHQNYQVLNVQPVPARRAEAVVANVRMQLTDRSVEVPFTLVWTGDTWLIECIELVRITGDGSGSVCR